MIYTDGDTICAISTPAGRGGIAVARISGRQAIAVAQKIWHGKPLCDVASHTAHLGAVDDCEGAPLDQAVATVFKAPRSFTGEDVVELSVHGSTYVQRALIAALIAAGARLAAPGEFTQRAFAARKMDLAQAEAIADIIAADSRAAHRLAATQLRGSFSEKITGLRSQLVDLASLLELELDFSEEDVEFASRERLNALAEDIYEVVKHLYDSFSAGNAIKSGIPVAIVGPTNAGKSSLLNALVGDDRAIVSDIHGTTRDVIEDATTINGIKFRFIDTAGIRTTDDAIEQLGIERTFEKLKQATIILWLTDKDTFDEEEQTAIDAIDTNQKVIIVRNKIDHNAYTQSPTQAKGVFRQIGISAKYGTNLEELKQAIYQAANIPEIHENDYLVTSARHYYSLRQSQEALQRVIEGLSANLSGDLISEDLRQVLFHLSEITGNTITTDEVLGNIFSHFCIGK